MATTMMKVGGICGGRAVHNIGAHIFRHHPLHAGHSNVFYLPNVDMLSSATLTDQVH